MLTDVAESWLALVHLGTDSLGYSLRYPLAEIWGFTVKNSTYNV